MSCGAFIRGGRFSGVMVLWVGIDDTDSLRGMCTTFLATEIVRELTHDFDLIGYPRLVRLNPNIPWKTRGNGALALRVGKGSGSPIPVGRIEGRDILAFPRARGPEDARSVFETVAGLLEEWSEFQDPTTNPACVVLRHRPSASLYWKAVRGVVTRSEARRALRGLGHTRAYKNGRGIIGAASAVAWRPRDRTYELLAYRSAVRWGTPRTIDAASVRDMDASFPSTFNNFDYVNGKVVIAPHSPCPVLFGIRGDDPRDLPSAATAIRGEAPERWLIFETNQGTDDHIRPGDWSLEPWTATTVQGTVASEPRTRSGGHVLLELQGPRRMTVAAYEPSKQFRSVVRALRPGDRLRVWGSVRDDPRTLNLEKVELVARAESLRKVSNPRCERCGKRMKSAGHDAGYRCPRCHARAPSSSATFVLEPREIRVGLYEPPASARRHISKPIKRLRAQTSSGLMGSGGRSRPVRPDFGALRLSDPREHATRVAR